MPGLSNTEIFPTQEWRLPANAPRKRQLDSDDDPDSRAKRARTTRPESEPAKLTRKNLALFNKMTNPQETSTHRDSYNATTTKSISTTAPGFDVRTYENGILDPRDSKPPKNLDDIRKRLAKTRTTASPPESVYENYVDKVGEAPNEATVVVQAVGNLLKEYPGKSYKQVFNQAFTGYPKEVGFNNGLSAPQPDFIEGLGMQEYRPFPVNKYVSGGVLYKDDRHSVTLPHIAGEWKGPGGSMPEATLQSAYDGAALVYARNQAHTYSGVEADPAGHAHVTTFTTNGSQLNFYAHYTALSEDGTLEYHQYPVKTTNLTDSYQEYKEGRKHLRNEQDCARQQSYELRDQLKDYYKTQRGDDDGPYPIAGEVPLSVPVSDIEPQNDDGKGEGDYEAIEHQPAYQPTPPTSSKHKKSKSHPHHSHSIPHSSKAPSSKHSSTHNIGHKRKAPPSSHSSSSGSSHHSKYKIYWKKDVPSGRYYHKHSDGTVSWLDDEEVEHD